MVFNLSKNFLTFIYIYLINLPIYIQAKATQTTPSYFKIREECPLKDKPFTVVWKKQDKEGGNSPGTVFIAPIELLWEYLILKLNK